MSAPGLASDDPLRCSTSPNRERSSRTFQIKLRNGGNPMPPATNSRSLPRAASTSNPLPKGPRIPTSSPFPSLCSASVNCPVRLTVVSNVCGRVGLEACKMEPLRSQTRTAQGIAREENGNPPRSSNRGSAMKTSWCRASRPRHPPDAQFLEGTHHSCQFPFLIAPTTAGMFVAPRHTLMHRPQPTHPTMASRW